MGVPLEEKPKMTIKALEDKDFTKNKVTLMKEKFEVGKMKIHNHSPPMKSNKDNYFMSPKKKSFSFSNMTKKNDKMSMFGVVKNDIKKDSKSNDLNLMKAKSDLFMGTNYNVKHKLLDNKKEKMNMFMGTNRGTNVNSKFHSMLVKKDIFAKNATIDGLETYDDTNTVDIATTDKVDWTNSKVAPEVSEGKAGSTFWDSLAKVGTGMNTVIDKTGTGMGNLAKAAFIGELTPEEQARKRMTEDPMTKQYMEYMALKHQQDLYAQGKFKPYVPASYTERGLMGIAKFGNSVGTLGQATAAVFPKVTTQRFKELGGFKVGPGAAYMAQSSLPQESAILKMDRYLNQGRMTRSMKPEEIDALKRAAARPMIPALNQSRIDASDPKALTQAYIEMQLKKRLSSGREWTDSSLDNFTKKIDAQDRKMTGTYKPRTQSQPATPASQPQEYQEEAQPAQRPSGKPEPELWRDKDGNTKISSKTGKPMYKGADNKPVDTIRGGYRARIPKGYKTTEV